MAPQQVQAPRELRREDAVARRDEPSTGRLAQWAQFYGLQPFSGWTVEAAVNALDAHVVGNFALSGRLQEDMSAHAWIGLALDKRLAVETECPTEFTVAGRTEAEKRRARRCRDFTKEVYPHVLPLETRRTLQRQRLMMGQTVFGMDWEELRDGTDKWWLPIIKPWEPTLTSYLQGAGMQDPYSVDGGSFVASTMSDGLVYVRPGDGRWGVWKHRLEKPWLSGIVYRLAMEFVGDGYNFRDNQTHQDRWGRGIVTVEYPSSMSQDDVAAHLSSVREGGGGGVLPLPQQSDGRGMKANILRADGAGFQTFDATERRIQRRILATVLRSDLSTVGDVGIAENDPRALQIWSCYADDACAQSDAQLTTEYDEATGEPVKVWGPCDGPQRRQIWSWVAHFNFGDAALSPYVWLNPTTPENREAHQDALAKRGQQRAGALASLAGSLGKFKDAGIVLSAADVEHLAEQCGVPLRAQPTEGATRGR